MIPDLQTNLAMNVNANVKWSMISLLLLLASSCNVSVFFAEANPPKSPELKQIPAQFRGRYVSELHGSAIVIGKRLIINETTVAYEGHFGRILSEIRCSSVEDDFTEILDSDCSYPRANDTIYIVERDTLFSFTDGRSAKLYQNSVFLNFPNQFNEYVTFILTPTGANSLLFRMIDIPGDQAVVRKYSKDYRTDHVRKKYPVYIIYPTPHEFDQILESDHLAPRDSLIKVSGRARSAGV